MILLIDADDTLLDFKKAEYTSITAAVKKFGAADPDGAARLFSAINKACWQDVEKAERTREQIAVERFYELKEKLSLNASAEVINEDYKENMRHAHFLLPGARDFLQALKARGHRLFMITNGLETTQTLRLKGSGIYDFFERIFISEAMGLRKPEREFFDRACSLIPAFDKSKCLVIGDSLSADIKGANNAGIPSIWFNAENKPLKDGVFPTYTAHSYSQILTFLDRYNVK